MPLTALVVTTVAGVLAAIPLVRAGGQAKARETLVPARVKRRHPGRLPRD